jgi:hypothetical protein
MCIKVMSKGILRQGWMCRVCASVGQALEQCEQGLNAVCSTAMEWEI